MSTKGFVVDAPNSLIISSNGNSQIVTAKKGEIKISGESIDINGGWSNYLLTKINTKKKIDITLTDAELKMQTLALQNGATVVSGAKERFIFGNSYAVATSKITVPYVVIAGSVLIDGFTEVETTVATKQFKVTVSAESTDISFFADVTDGTVITPVFRTSIANSESISAITDGFAGTAQFILEYPVHGKDVNNNDIQSGVVQFVIFKASIETDFSMGGSYKSATEFELKASGLDPQRPDKKVFEVNYFPIVVA